MIQDKMNIEERRKLLMAEIRMHPDVCRVSHYTDNEMYVKCPCPRKCINKYKYHRYTIVDDAVELGGDFRSSHCSVVGSGKPIALLFNENNHRAEKIPFGLNLKTGRVYKRKRKPYKVAQV
tara:strand:+ start:2501 stop:2863 length:363 start_codon:yes stop_codon:yes gene_type:complete